MTKNPKIILDNIEKKIIREYTVTLPYLLIDWCHILHEGDIYHVVEDYPETHYLD